MPRRRNSAGTLPSPAAVIPPPGIARLLMCPPRYYGVEYEINVWMSLRRSADRVAAQGQWNRLYATLTEELGATVELVEPVPNLPDMCFTANAGLVRGNRVVLSNFRHPERRGEAAHFRAWFEQAGFEVIALAAERAFEGEGDAMFVGEELFAGYRFRSDIHSHRLLGEVFGRRVLSLELVDPRFYHLDTCFCPLGPDRAMYYRPAFDEYAQRVLAAHLPDSIHVTEEDAVCFGCNAIVLGDAVVMNAGCKTLPRQLQEAGYRVIGLPLGEFLKAGGAAKCLVLRLA